MHTHSAPEPAAAPLFGLGLRKPHYAEVLSGESLGDGGLGSAAALDFVEVISENFMVAGGRPRDVLRRARASYPVALHGVSMSLGSADGLDPDHLRQLKLLADEIEPAIVSDHLCWTRSGTAHGGFQSHDLLPLPYTREALAVVSANIDHAQAALGRQLLIENPSSYVAFANSDMAEWEFLAELSARTGCGLLLDVNNVFVSSINHGWDAGAYLAGLPLDRVGQVHLAGHTTREIAGQDLLIDTHDQPVRGEVWELYAQTMAQIAAAGGAPWVMIERDDNIPPLADLLGELAIARTLAAQSRAA